MGRDRRAGSSRSTDRSSASPVADEGRQRMSAVAAPHPAWARARSSPRRSAPSSRCSSGGRPTSTYVGSAFTEVQLGVGGRRDRDEPAVRRRAVDRLAHRPEPGAAGAAPTPPPRLLRLLASACSATPSCPGRVGEVARVGVLGAARARTGAATWAADPRLGLRAPALRRHPDDRARRLRPRRREDPAAGRSRASRSCSRSAVALLARRLRARLAAPPPRSAVARRAPGRVAPALRTMSARRAARAALARARAGRGAFFQLLGWTTQLFAVYFAFTAFGIDEPIGRRRARAPRRSTSRSRSRSGPGASASSRRPSRSRCSRTAIAYQHGFAYGIGLQAIEMSVGVGLGLLFLAREGISFAMLKQIPRVTRERRGGARGSRVRARSAARRSAPARDGVAATRASERVG